jgi:hypothetical protein
MSHCAVTLFLDVVCAVRQGQTYNVEFIYCGSDEHVIIDAELEDCIECRGLMNAAELCREIGKCHAGILFSAYGEGSPFIIVETLACGRVFIVPPLRTLCNAYKIFLG